MASVIVIVFLLHVGVLQLSEDWLDIHKLTCMQFNERATVNSSVNTNVFSCLTQQLVLNLTKSFCFLLKKNGLKNCATQRSEKKGKF